MKLIHDTEDQHWVQPYAFLHQKTLLHIEHEGGDSDLYTYDLETGEAAIHCRLEGMIWKIVSDGKWVVATTLSGNVWVSHFEKGETFHLLDHRQDLSHCKIRDINLYDGVLVMTFRNKESGYRLQVVDLDKEETFEKTLNSCHYVDAILLDREHLAVANHMHCDRWEKICHSERFNICVVHMKTGRVVHQQFDPHLDQKWHHIYQYGKRSVVAVNDTNKTLDIYDFNKKAIRHYPFPFDRIAHLEVICERFVACLVDETDFHGVQSTRLSILDLELGEVTDNEEQKLVSWVDFSKAS